MIGHAAALPGATTAPGGDVLRLSVVIPSTTRPDLLCRCLAAVFAQSLDPRAYEVIIVEEGRSPHTQALVEVFRAQPQAPVLRLVRPREGSGRAVARNAGWRAAYGRVIAFTDEDTVPARDWLVEGEKALRPGLVAVAGRVAVAPAWVHPIVALVEGRSATCADAPGAEEAGFLAANAFVRRSALLAVGGFDERFERAWREDSDLHFRLLRDAGPLAHSEAAVVQRPLRPQPWGRSLGQQKDAFFDALLYKKHPRLYREQLAASPPWGHYAVVALTLMAVLLEIVGIPGSAAVSLLLALAGVVVLARQRRRGARGVRERLLETVCTSALIPFLSVYWRLRGAIHFRVLFF